MENLTYGYARVSAKDQNLARQIIALRDFGVQDEMLFLDKESGKDFNRTQYRRMMRKLKKGDTVVIKSIDRLGRNYEEIIEQWRRITKETGYAIVGYAAESRSNRNLNCGHRATAAFLCGADRT